MTVPCQEAKIASACIAKRFNLIVIRSNATAQTKGAHQSVPTLC